jgi:hypothetical protein
MNTRSILDETHLTPWAWYAAAASLLLGGIAIYSMGRHRVASNLQTMLPAWDVTKRSAPRRAATAKRRRKA